VSEAVLSVRGLARSYGDHQVLADFDLEIGAGRAAVLVGPNGSGKSTALRCITGADQADAGTVEVLGEALDERSATIRAAMAVVMDDLDFFPDLTVVEHLDLFARAHRTPDADAVVDDVLEEVGLTAQSGLLPTSLSSGQRRRLALASAFVRPRRLLVLDEPEQRLDQEGLAWLAERLVAEKASGLAIVLASHAPALVDAVADDVVSLARP